MKAERRSTGQAARPTSGDDLSIPINLCWVMCSEGPVVTAGIHSCGLGGVVDRYVLYLVLVSTGC